MSSTPYTVDYIAQSSMGMFNGYYSFLNTSAGVITSSGVIKLQEYVPVQSIYVVLGCVVCLVSVFLAFALNDVHLYQAKQIDPVLDDKKFLLDEADRVESEGPEEGEEFTFEAKKNKCGRIFKDAVKGIMAEKGILVGSFAGACGMMSYLSAVNFGTNAFNDLYQTDEASKKYISDQISLYFLISHMCVLIPCLFYGYLLDKVRNWKMVFVF